MAYPVFLSSTSRDLQPYRDTVRDAIAGLDGFEVVAMEDFGARDDAPRDLCAELVAKSAIYVGVMGHYYGSCPPDEPTSFTELEYEAAADANLPRLIFAAPDDFAIPATLRESDDSFNKQRAFRERVMQERVAASFASAEQLASAVTIALSNWRQKQQPPQQEGLAEAPAAPIAPPTEPAKLGQNPYRGLEAFRKEDAARFFGRETLVERLWEMFLELHRTSTSDDTAVRLLAILGASGSGKSSVAQAGLLAALEDRPLPGRLSPPAAVLTPEARPLESLAVALARLATGEAAPAGKAKEFEKILRDSEDGDGLRYLAEHMLGAERAGIILLIDQFEEIYSLCDDEEDRAVFIANLLHAASAPGGRVSIIVTLRSDFLGAVNQHPELSRLIAAQNEVVPVMSEAELRQTITEPAKAAGREIDPGTVDLLIEQTAGREGSLPLLEFVLTRIWEGFAKSTSAAETVHALGGVGGAVAREAQGLYDGLSLPQQAIARRAFLAMVRLGEGTRDTRRRALVGDLVARGEQPLDVRRVLDLFAQPEQRLITFTATSEGASAVEVSHEALFEHWAELQGWLSEDRDKVRLGRRLEAEVKDWLAQDRPPGMLWRPPLLDLLRDYHAAKTDDMPAPQIAFFEASERQHKRGLWFRRGGIAAAIGALLLVAGGLTIYSRQQAENARREAEFAQRQTELRQEADAAKDEAVRQAEMARSEKERADAQRDEALKTQSLLLAELSEQETEAGKTTAGILLALEALPENMAAPERPYVVETEAALYRAVLEHRGQAVLRGHQGPVWSAAVSPDGTKVVTGSSDGTARLWDSASGEPLAVLSASEEGVMSAAFGPDGTLVTVSPNGTARLWDVATAQLMTTLEGHSEATSAAVSRDGTNVVTSAKDGTARLWDVTSGETLARLQALEDGVTSAAFGPDGTRAVTVPADGIPQLWDVATGQLLATLEGHGGEVNSVAFSPDGAKVATGSRDGTARLWDSVSGETLAVLQGHKDLLVRVGAAAFSPDGAKVVTASDDRTARLWNTVSGEELMVLHGHDRPVRSAAFSPDGTAIVTASEDGTARLWNIEGSRLVKVLAGHQDSLRAAAFDPSGQRIITGSVDRTAGLWDATDGRYLSTLQGHGDEVRSVAFAPDGARAVTAADDGTMRIWEIPSGRELTVITGADGEKFRAAIFAPDGASIVAATSAGVARLWHVSGGDPIRSFDGHEDSVRSVDVSSDGLWVLTASYDRTARVWDIETGEEIARLEGHEAPLIWAAFSPDRKQVVTAAKDGMVRVWDLARRETVVKLMGHQGTVRSAGFSPDGRRIVTASTDHTARLWDAATGNQLAVLRGHQRPVVAAGFSPDGTRVVTASTDDTARIWRVFQTTQELIDYAKSIVPWELATGERRRLLEAE